MRNKRSITSARIQFPSDFQFPSPEDETDFRKWEQEKSSLISLWRKLTKDDLVSQLAVANWKSESAQPSDRQMGAPPETDPAQTSAQVADQIEAQIRAQIPDHFHPEIRGRIPNFLFGEEREYSRVIESLLSPLTRSQLSRRTGGENRGKQKKNESVERKAKIFEKEAALVAEGVRPRGMNKKIATALDEDTRYVERARRERNKQKPNGS